MSPYFKISLSIFSLSLIISSLNVYATPTGSNKSQNVLSSEAFKKELKEKQSSQKTRTERLLGHDQEREGMGKADPDPEGTLMKKMTEENRRHWEQRKQALIEQGKIKPMQRSEALQRELDRRKQASKEKEKLTAVEKSEPVQQ